MRKILDWFMLKLGYVRATRRRTPQGAAAWYDQQTARWPKNVGVLDTLHHQRPAAGDKRIAPTGLGGF